MPILGPGINLVYLELVRFVAMTCISRLFHVLPQALLFHLGTKQLECFDMFIPSSYHRM